MDYVWSALFMVIVGGVSFRIWQFLGTLISEYRADWVAERKRKYDE